MGAILLVGNRLEDVTASVTDDFVQLCDARFAEDNSLWSSTPLSKMSWEMSDRQGKWKLERPGFEQASFHLNACFCLQCSGVVFAGRQKRSSGRFRRGRRSANLAPCTPCRPLQTSSSAPTMHPKLRGGLPMATGLYLPQFAS